MALISCPECAHQVSDSAAVCPNCGYALRAEARGSQVNTWMDRNALVASLAFLVAVCVSV